MNGKKKLIHYIGILGLYILFCSTTVYFARKSYQFGRLSDSHRERLIIAERTNSELRATVGECKSICRELSEATGRNITSVRNAIELVEEIRAQVYSLEMALGSFDWDNYYSYWDNELGIQGE